MTQKQIVDILRAGGYIKNWLNLRYRLMDKHHNPVRILSGFKFQKLWNRQLLKKVNAAYVYQKNPERIYEELLPFEVSHDRWKTCIVVHAYTIGKAKSKLFKELKSKLPELKYEQIKVRKPRSSSTRGSIKPAGCNQEKR